MERKLYKCLEFYSDTKVIVVILLIVSSLWCVLFHTKNEVPITVKGARKLRSKYQKSINSHQLNLSTSSIHQLQGNSSGALVDENHIKVLCFVLTSPSRFQASQVIKETWGSRCDKLVFYGGFQNKQLPVIQLNVTEGYRFLWGKTKAALVHLAEHFSKV